MASGIYGSNMSFRSLEFDTKKGIENLSAAFARLLGRRVASTVVQAPVPTERDLLGSDAPPAPVYEYDPTILPKRAGQDDQGDYPEDGWNSAPPPDDQPAEKSILDTHFPLD